MRETNFINQNKQKWDDFEHMLKRKDSDPDKLSELFVQVTDDLSYSRTFYPNRSVKVYLNSIAQAIFLNLYKNKKGQRGRFLDFWVDELPRIMYEGRKAMLLSFLVFTLFMGIGMLSTVNDPTFPEFILGPGYMHMTEENIERGDPMGVYKDEAEDIMFLRITFNNIRVSMITFIFGVLASVGTIFILIKNAIMLGAFQQYFIDKGLFTEMFFSVWVHGALEISAIVLAGGAGIIFGSGLIIPGTYSRGQAFIQSARRGLMIIVGIIPLFIIAGFIESFITRYTEAPIVLRGAIIFTSFFLVLLYYVYYPWRKAKAGFKERYARDEITTNQIQNIDWGRIRSIGEVVAEALPAVTKFMGRFVMVGALAGAVYGLLAILLYADNMGVQYNFYGEVFEIFNLPRIIEQIGLLISDIFEVYRFEERPVFMAINLLFWVSLGAVGMAVNRKLQANDFTTKGLWLLTWQALAKHWLGLVVVSVLIIALLSFVLSAWLGLLFPGLFLLIGITVTMDSENTNVLVATRKTFGGLKGHVFFVLALNFIIIILMFLFIGLFSSLLFALYIESIHMLLGFEDDTMNLIVAFFTYTLGGIIVSILFAVMASSAKIMLQSSKEANEATDLIRRIELLGTKKRVYGFEQEV